MKVYLAGPISGLSYEGAVDWREYAEERLSDTLGPFVDPRSPMRMKEHLKHVEEFRPTGYDTEEIMDSRAVVARDIFDVRTADVILMNLAHVERVSVGTMIELGAAAALNKLVVTVMPYEERTERPAGRGVTSSPNPHDHLFVYELSGIVVPDLDAAIEVISAL